MLHFDTRFIRFSFIQFEKWHSFQMTTFLNPFRVPMAEKAGTSLEPGFNRAKVDCGESGWRDGWFSGRLQGCFQAYLTRRWRNLGQELNWRQRRGRLGHKIDGKAEPSSGSPVSSSRHRKGVRGNRRWLSKNNKITKRKARNAKGGAAITKAAQFGTLSEMRSQGLAIFSRVSWPFHLATLEPSWTPSDTSIIATGHFSFHLADHCSTQKKERKIPKVVQQLETTRSGSIQFHPVARIGALASPPPHLAAVTSTGSSNQLIDQGKSADNFPFTVSLGHGTDRKCSRHRKQRLFPARKR